MRQNNIRFVVFIPILVALAVTFGIFIGQKIVVKGQGPSQSLFKLGRGEKIDEIVDLIYSDYVDTVNRDKLVEDAIVAMLEKLDPHSNYIPPVDLQAVNEELDGNFEGIGVEFNINKDTIIVVSAIPGGPSESVGIRAGDRIVKIEDEVVAGKKIKNEDVIKRLRGKKGTKVNVTIVRPSQRTDLVFTIKRDRIPIYSVDVSYMLDAETGYIKISRFAATTYEEFVEAMNLLLAKGMKKMVLDLRGNPGGYLDAATEIADEFLPNKKRIVYTEGKARRRHYYNATSSGSFEKQPLVILIDEGSASASEIIAGAIQDNDRGTIVGRRSFGKGLVQEQIDLGDGSALRLTVARYYTPTGRSIQRPYDKGIEAYYMDAYSSILHEDSLPKSDSLKFTTPGGKVVYGGGGIYPDYYVKYDTSGYSNYLSEVVNKGIIYDFSFDYADKNRDRLIRTYGNYLNFAKNTSAIQHIMNSFLAYADGKGIKRETTQINQSRKLLENRLLSLVARNIWNNEAYYYILNMNDEIMLKAMEVLR